jgi:hypothetical protein
MKVQIIFTLLLCMAIPLTASESENELMEYNQLLPQKDPLPNNPKKSGCEWPFKWKYSTKNDSDTFEDNKTLSTMAGAICCATGCATNVVFCLNLSKETNNQPISFLQTLDNFFGCTDCNPCHIAGHLITAIGCCWMGITMSECISEEACNNGKWCNRCIKKK